MEIKIGVQDTAREVSLDSNDNSESVIAAINEAIATAGILTLIDDRGRTVIVPAAKLAYVEISPNTKGRVGFGS